MLEKTIKQILVKKVNKWLETIDDDTVVKAIKEDLIITGGCITSMMVNENPNDYDCYFRTRETVLKVANYYAKRWNSDHEGQENKIGQKCKVFVFDCDNPSDELLDYYKVNDPEKSRSVMVSNMEEGRIKMIFPSDGIVGDPDAANASEEMGVDSIPEIIEEIDEQSADDKIKKEKRPYTPVFISTNAITLSDGIQIVVRFFGEPADVHDTFDFVHTRAYYDHAQKEVVIPKEVYEAVMNKTLVYTGSRYPLCSVFRLRKFIQRGWKVNVGQMLKMCMQISELDLTDIDVLEDQLIGVDSLYFMNLIAQFRKMQDGDDTFELNPGYIVSIIDKVFQ